MNIVALLAFFTGFHAPQNAIENEVCRGAEAVLLSHHPTYTAERHQCAVKLIDEDVCSSFWNAKTVSGYYKVIGCIKNEQRICKGYTIYMPYCQGCVYGSVSEDQELTSNFKELMKILF